MKDESDRCWIIHPSSLLRKDFAAESMTSFFGRKLPIPQDDKESKDDRMSGRYNSKARCRGRFSAFLFPMGAQAGATGGGNIVGLTHCIVFSALLFGQSANQQDPNKTEASSSSNGAEAASRRRFRRSHQP